MLLTWVAPSLDGCAAGAVGWVGAERAKEPGATVDGGLVLVLPLLPLMSSATSEPGVCGVWDIISEPKSCVCLQRGVEKKDDILLWDNIFHGAHESGQFRKKEKEIRRKRNFDRRICAKNLSPFPMIMAPKGWRGHFVQRLNLTVLCNINSKLRLLAQPDSCTRNTWGSKAGAQCSSRSLTQT